MESEMADFISSLEDSGIPETMLEATRKAFGATFGLPEPPVHTANTVQWIVSESALPMTQVDNYVRSMKNSGIVRRASNGDYIARATLMKQVGARLGIPVFEKANTVDEIMEAARKNRERPMDESAGRKANLETYYRGFNSKDSSEGSIFNQLACPGNALWMTPYIEYAIRYATNYGNDGRVARLLVDGSKMEVACGDDLDEVGYDTIDAIDIGNDQEAINGLRKMGINTVSNYLDDSEDGYCVFDPRIIKQVNVLSPEELANSNVDMDDLADISDKHADCVKWYNRFTGRSGKTLVETVCYREGHKNSDGEDAPWVIVSHKTGKILSSHKSEKKAKEHLRQMEYFKNLKESADFPGNPLVEDHFDDPKMEKAIDTACRIAGVDDEGDLSDVNHTFNDPYHQRCIVSNFN